jgi:hypothetical protein
MKRYFNILMIFVFPIVLTSQVGLTPYNDFEETGRITFDKETKITGTVELVNAKILNPVFKMNLSNNVTILNGESLDSINGSDMLYPGQFSAFELDTRTKKVKYIGPVYEINSKCYEALEIVPKWIEDQLLLKFRELHSLDLDDDYAQIILDAADISHYIVDEVAFTVANLSATSLNHSRFKSDKEYIIRIAQFIYMVKDSLKYVDLVEHGNYESRDYYTTTKYRIADGLNGAVDWYEIPYEYYYWYIVHPKINGEGVWVQDNVNDQQQRTWGYSWQDYIWFNPDPSHDYTQVNLSSDVGTVNTIQRFGDIMQKPDVLWNRNKNYYLFGRDLNSYDHALDLLGNWGSRAIPADPIIGESRAIHPNQILYEHRGRCGEDSYLMTAACRTALIPTICAGTHREDHVFDQIWDNDWNHFEFFRGGLANSGWGWTNLMDRGGYEELSPDYWILSFVHGYRPDGYIFNHTPYYTDVCYLKLRLVDENDNPLDGVQVQIFAKPGHPGDNNIVYSGQAFTNSLGSVDIEAGDGKVYYLRLYHPSFGYLPSEEQVYILTNQYTYTSAGQTYDAGTMKIPVTLNQLKTVSNKAPENGDFGLHLKWSSTEIITGIKERAGGIEMDYQRSRFYFWNDTSGAVSFFVCDSANYQLFKAGNEFEAFEAYNYTESGDVYVAFPNEGKWYAVLANAQALNNYDFVEANCGLLENVSTSVVVNGDPVVSVSNIIDSEQFVFNVLPNPFGGECRFQLPVNTEKVMVYNSVGQMIDIIQYPFIWKPEPELSNGIYFFKAYNGDYVISAKAVLYR